MVCAFEECVKEIDEKTKREQAEKPTVPRFEIVFVSVIFIHLIRKENRAHQEKIDSVRNYKQIRFKCPLNGVELKFPPPEMNHEKQDNEHPAQVDGIYANLFGMLNELCKAIEQARKCQRKYHSDNQTAMFE